MSNLILGNRDYGPAGDGWGAHMSDEGYQLQAGLVAAGWEICGNGYGDNCADVDVLLERFTPEVVFVQDVRDWLPESPIKFRKDLGFRNIDALGRSGGGLSALKWLSVPQRGHLICNSANSPTPSFRRQ